VVRVSGNVFRDVRHKDADAARFKAVLAAEIIKALDRERVTVRAAHSRTGIAVADFRAFGALISDGSPSNRFMGILNRLGFRIEAKVRVQAV